MDCVLHIGTEKTGTTSIQRTLDANAERLAQHGMVWPEMFHKGEDTRMVCYAMDDDTEDLRKRRRNLTTPEAIATYRAQFESRFAREIGPARPDGTVVIVNEHLSRMRNPSELARLKTFLERHFDDVRVVVYLRRQDRMMRSLYATVVRMGGTRRNVFPVPDGPHAEAFITFNYRRIVDLWAEAFGRAALSIRVFDPETLFGRDAVLDFFHTIGHDLPDGVVPLRMNESLSREALLTLRLLNRHLPREARGNLGPLSARLFAGSGMPVAQAEAAAFLAHFEADNDHVAQTYLGQPRLFAPIGPQEYPEHVDEADLQPHPDTMARIFAQLWEARVRRV